MDDLGVPLFLETPISSSDCYLETRLESPKSPRPRNGVTGVIGERDVMPGELETAATPMNFGNKNRRWRQMR